MFFLHILFVKNIGGSGFLGHHLVKLIEERDDNVKEIRIVDLVPYKNCSSKFLPNQPLLNLS